jgi:hypothetical protein
MSRSPREEGNDFVSEKPRKKKTRKDKETMDKPSTGPKILGGKPPLSVGELLCNKSRWGRGYDAQTATGDPVAVFNENAIRWCLGGAMRLVYGHDAQLHQKMTKLINDWLLEHKEEFEEADDVSLSGWNDEPERTWKEIRQMLNATKV